ncbi:MAG: cytochrome c-type biogenesis protein CcmH [Actinomycetes bacterium]
MASKHPIRQQRWTWALMACAAIALIVFAARPTPQTGAGDQRRFALASQLKCLQCVGESVGASQAPLAVKFREEIDRQMRQGRTNDEILNYFAQRYGRQVLETPPATGLGALVWIVPVVAVAAAVGLLTLTFRRWAAERVALAPSADDEALVTSALRRRRTTTTDTRGVDRGDERGR